MLENRSFINFKKCELYESLLGELEQGDPNQRRIGIISIEASLTDEEIDERVKNWVEVNGRKELLILVTNYGGLKKATGS